MKKLFEPGRIGNLTIKNRALMMPMETLYGESDGRAGTRIQSYYAERAKGGVGMIIVEATSVDVMNNVPWAHQLLLTTDLNNSGFQELAEAIHKYDCFAFIQLHHLGAKSAMPPAGAIWGPSEVPAVPGAPAPHRMRVEEIKTVEQRFIDAAVRAKKAGFDGVEIAGAHGYLLAQFLSPYYNDRTDAYGGCAQNRCRIVTEIMEGIHAALGKGFPISVRFPGDEFTPDLPNTLTVDDCQELARIFEKAGAALLNVSYGNNFNPDANCEPYSYRAGWKKHVAKAVKAAVSIPVTTTNTIKDPEFAEQMLQEGVCDFVGLGRSLVADADFMKKAKAGDTLGVRKCLGCMYCREQVLFRQLPLQCSINPRAGSEYIYPAAYPKDGEGRNVAVLGGGPAGMEAAAVLAGRGFCVTLFEKENVLGGTLNLADKGKSKEKITKMTATMAEELRRLNVRLMLGVEATVDAVRSICPAGVVVACGAEAIIPPLEGVGQDFVLSAQDVIAEKGCVSGNVVIVGTGMTGLECAEKLFMEGCRVTLVEMLGEVGPGIYPTIRNVLWNDLKVYAPDVYTSHALTAIQNKAVALKNLKTGEALSIPADHVVLSLGVRPRATVIEAFRAAFDNVIAVGDNHQGGNIPRAMRDAYTKALVFLS